MSLTATVQKVDRFSRFHSHPLSDEKLNIDIVRLKYEERTCTICTPVDTCKEGEEVEIVLVHSDHGLPPRIELAS